MRGVTATITVVNPKAPTLKDIFASLIFIKFSNLSGFKQTCSIPQIKTRFSTNCQHLLLRNLHRLLRLRACLERDDHRIGIYFRHSIAGVRVRSEVERISFFDILLIGIPFFIPSAPFPPKARGRWGFKPKLVTSTDGLHWEVVTHLDIPGRPNEATVRVRRDGEMIALVRRERGTYFGWIGVSQSPYKEWTWHETEHRLGGPNFIVLPDDSLIAAGRKYRDPFSTVVASMDREHYDVQLILPSGGSDTGYPGMVWHEGELWVSYYSSHEDKEGNPPPNRHTALPTAIYIARVKLE
jgi:hypothetical protein